LNEEDQTTDTVISSEIIVAQFPFFFKAPNPRRNEEE